MPLPSELVAELTALVGEEHVRDAAALAGLDPGVDSHNLGAGLWLRPGSTAELAAVLQRCNAYRVPVVPHGGKTGLSGGAVSRSTDVVISLERFTDLAVDAVSRTVRAGAGVRLSVLAEAVAAFGLGVGVDLGARDSATVGGMVSTNAGGIAAFRHGTVRERVLGLEAVLADGSVLRELGEVIKRNEGLAVERLLIGAEGTLGVVTHTTLLLTPLDGPSATALVALGDFHRAAQLTHALLAARDVTPTALELMSGNHATAVCRARGYHDLLPLATAPFLMLVELAAATVEGAEAGLLAALERAAAEGLVDDAAIARNEAQRHVFWQVREDWAVDRERPGGLWYDISVPLRRAADYLADLRSRLCAHDDTLDLYVIGHLADGNLHVTVNSTVPITERYDEIAALVTAPLIALGGSYSAEHGIGVEKKATLQRHIHPTKRRLMRQVKALFDPNGIMNPGKVIPD